MKFWSFAAVFTVSIAAGFATPQAAEWPGYQGNLQAGETNSPNKAALPSDVSIITPDSRVPKALTPYSGKWIGWMGRNRSASASVAVEKISESGATIVYVYADEKTAGNPVRFDMKVDGAELTGKTPKGHEVSLRIRADGHMDVLWKSASGGDVSSGVLSRQQ